MEHPQKAGMSIKVWKNASTKRGAASKKKQLMENDSLIGWAYLQQMFFARSDSIWLVIVWAEHTQNRATKR